MKGDEITLIEKLENLSRGGAIERYLSLANVEPSRRKTSCSRTRVIGLADKIDWPAAVGQFSPDHAARLAVWRGYSSEFVKWLRDRELIGIYKRNLALPVHNESGEVIAAHVRSKTGRWFYAPRGAGCQPLVIGDLGATTNTMVFESQWDAFAVMDQCGWHREEPDGWSILITRGASNGRFSARVSGDIYAWPQNDFEKEGRRPGEEWLHDVAMHARGNVFRVAVPTQFKDANDWYRAEQ